MGNLSVRTWIYMGLGAVLVIGNLFAFWPFFAAEKQMQAFCAGIPPGTPLADVKSRAAAEGYEVTRAADGPARVEDPRSLGRRYCDLPVNGAGVVAGR